ncbi:MAG: ParA family protein [Ignavibacteria bacterium]|nr:ParA family protein [Ignavibacteria bacterium]
MKIIAVYSIKGGVGKTASSVNLAYLAARAGYKTLLCDLDPQSSTSYYFRIRPSKKFDSGKLIDENKNIEKYIKQSDFDNLDILPSDFSYRNLDLLLDNVKKSKKKLKSVLKNLKGNYDIIFLDCPPNITLFSENIFNAADIITEPCIPTTLSILTHEKLYDFLKDSDFNPESLYTFYSMVELRKKMHKEIMQQNTDNSNFLSSFIPYCSDIEKMGIHLQPVFIFAPSGKAAKSYEKLWNEFNNILF